MVPPSLILPPPLSSRSSCSIAFIAASLLTALAFHRLSACWVPSNCFFIFAICTCATIAGSRRVRTRLPLPSPPPSWLPPPPLPPPLGLPRPGPRPAPLGRADSPAAAVARPAVGANAAVAGPGGAIVGPTGADWGPARPTGSPALGPAGLAESAVSADSPAELVSCSYQQSSLRMTLKRRGQLLSGIPPLARKAGMQSLR